ncbi:hypothetical protein [Paraburkholderia phenazinium]|uniref:hypothetical protein n=1 Tax=Paraburkholderia phenazinium TaxID=60549 RepID=UPI0015897B55|nr:hypothetical protein [Paraburkholderia phenazinium]
MTLAVRERQYAVGKAGERCQVLKTGYLSTCIAFYGHHKHKKVAFLCHIDAHPFGLGRLVEDVREQAGADLRGFNLYVTSGMSLWLRLLVWISPTAVTYLAFSGGSWSKWLWASISAAAFLYYLLPGLVGYIHLGLAFKTPCLSIKNVQILPRARVEITVDPSKPEPDDPIPESVNVRRPSKKRFRMREDSCWVNPISQHRGSMSLPREQNAFERTMIRIGSLRCLQWLDRLASAALYTSHLLMLMAVIASVILYFIRPHSSQRPTSHHSKTVQPDRQQSNTSSVAPPR